MRKTILLKSSDCAPGDSCLTVSNVLQRCFWPKFQHHFTTGEAASVRSNDVNLNPTGELSFYIEAAGLGTHHAFF